MIKFFRKIRQRLLSENRLGKYLLYAIGEIALVMIGILLALQVNNWNEERKKRIEEQVVLEQLYKEFKNNLAQLDEKIGIRNSIIKGSSKLYEYIDNPSLRQNDSILKFTGVLGLSATFDPIRTDYVSSGKLQLISDQRLKELLTFWTTELVQLTEEEVNYYDYRNEIYRPFVQEHFVVRSMYDQMWNDSGFLSFLLDKSKDIDPSSTPSQHQQDLSPLLDEIEFENLVSQARVLAIICNLQSYTLRERIEEIISRIESEIQGTS
jgi:hypothetical protein